MIPELRWNIFQLIHDASDGPGAWHKTLLALALTCKSFTEPALKLLWRDLPGLAPLIKCLPRSLWKQVEQKLEFQRAMTLHDWSIFCKYNHHVRSLRIDVYPLVGTEFWHALSCPPFSLPLLPNLMSLAWELASTEKFLCIRLFVGPKITKLELYPCTFDPSENSILSCISMLCPSVSQFELIPDTRSTEDPSTALQGWSHLTSVTTSTVSVACMLHLSKLPSLQILRFELTSTFMSLITQKLQHPVFCALQELYMKCSSLVLLDAFFEKFFIAPKTINLEVTGSVDSARALSASFSRLSNGCVRDSLECMEFYIASQPTDRVTSIRIAVLRPLFVFRNLRKLEFIASLKYVLRWDDAVLLQIAKSWPLMEVLHLNRHDPSNRGVTPNAFTSLLQHCPCLISVAVIVNWSTIDECDVSQDAPYGGFAHKTLSEAFFGSPRIHHPTRIAAFISAIAPKLESIVTWDSQYGREQQDFKKYSARWKCVCDSVKAFSAVREQVRRMVLNAAEGASGNKGADNHYGIAQPAHGTENCDGAIGENDNGEGGEVSEDSGSEGESEHMSDESSEEDE